MEFAREPIFLGLLFVCGWIPACSDKEEIKVYRVSKPEPAARQDAVPANAGTGTKPPMGASPEAVLPDANPSQVPGNPPPNWEAQPLTSMRQASFLVKGENGAVADISLVTIEGAGGGLLDNVNRWLSQLGQPPIASDQLATTAQHLGSALGDVTVVDLAGLAEGADAAKDGRIIAGIASGEGRTFFFKMRGNAALAESQKEGFIRWIGSVRMAGTKPESPHP